MFALTVSCIACEYTHCTTLYTILYNTIQRKLKNCWRSRQVVGKDTICFLGKACWIAGIAVHFTFIIRCSACTLFFYNWVKFLYCSLFQGKCSSLIVWVNDETRSTFNRDANLVTPYYYAGTESQGCCFQNGWCPQSLV